MDDLSSWDTFVLRHKLPLNLGIHFLSFVVYYGGPVAALIFHNPWYLLGLPLSGMIGAFGHFVSGDGGVKVQEATFSPQVVFYVTVMFYKIARGRYGRDIAKAEMKLRRQLERNEYEPVPESDAGKIPSRRRQDFQETRI
jgi:hypothetical protein